MFTIFWRNVLDEKYCKTLYRLVIGSTWHTWEYIGNTWEYWEYIGNTWEYVGIYTYSQDLGIHGNTVPGMGKVQKDLTVGRLPEPGTETLLPPLIKPNNLLTTTTSPTTPCLVNLSTPRDSDVMGEGRTKLEDWDAGSDQLGVVTVRPTWNTVATRFWRWCGVHAR